MKATGWAIFMSTAVLYPLVLGTKRSQATLVRACVRGTHKEGDSVPVTTETRGLSLGSAGPRDD